MLSYSQRHYDIYISNYSEFVIRVIKIHQLPPVLLCSETVENGQTTMSRILTFTHIKLSQVLNFLYTRYVEFAYKFINVLL